MISSLISVEPREDPVPVPQAEFIAQSRRLALWLRQDALPIWSGQGQDAQGGFVEAMTLDGYPLTTPRRARVQTRQIQVFVEAGQLGWTGPWRTIVHRGLERLKTVHLRNDGLMRALTGDDGAALQDGARVYDQAFLLFAYAAVHRADLATGYDVAATDLRDRLLGQAPVEGGLVEEGDHPYQSNANMHMLEASLAWEEAHGDAQWSALSDRIVDLARRHFIEPNDGFLREFFSADWSPAHGDDGRLVEPGHQFEWAWLLARYGRRRGDNDAITAARKLYAAGVKGVDPRRAVAIDALNADGSTRSDRARLWPQTEWLKAALILAELSDHEERARLWADASTALHAVWRYLTPEGLWRDTMLTDGRFVDEPAPASSFYHLMAAFSQISATTGAVGLDSRLLAEEIRIDARGARDWVRRPSGPQTDPGQRKPSRPVS